MPPDPPRRADAVALGIAVLFPTLAAWLYFVVFAGTGAMAPLYAGCKVAQFAFPALWVAARRRRWLPERTRARGGWRAGAISGLALGSVLLAAWSVAAAWTPLLGPLAAGILRKVTEIGTATPGRYLAMGLFFALIHSFLEEYYWRWFVTGGLRRYLRPQAALTVGSLAFASHHAIVLGVLLGPALWWGAVLGVAAVAGAGAVWAWQYDRTGGMAAPWLSHAIVDLTLMAIGYRLIESAL